MAAPAWRLIVEGPVDGALNMALDRAVTACRADGSSPPTLRLYRWAAPTVSLGRFQSLEQVDLTAAADRGFDVVRRPTGGRGVLHDDELTYAVVAAVADGVPRGVAASYRHFSRALAEAYGRLGVDAALTSRSRGTRGASACYLHATAADLSRGATKLSGSAQMWSGDTVLQHGSFVVSRDARAEGEVFRLDAAGVAELEARTSTLEGELGVRPSVDEIAGAVVAAFEKVLGLTLEPGGFSDHERELAREAACEHEIARGARPR